MPPPITRAQTWNDWQPSKGPTAKGSAMLSGPLVLTDAIRLRHGNGRMAEPFSSGRGYPDGVPWGLPVKLGMLLPSR